MGGALKRRKYDENYEVKAYEKFCKKLKFIEGKEITVKVNEKFAAKYYANFTVPPEYQGSFPVVKTNDDDITLTFDEFYQMYCIDPSKWELENFADNYFARYEVRDKFPRYESIYFKRTKDYYRFKKFVLNKRSQKNIETANEKKLEVLKG